MAKVKISGSVPTVCGTPGVFASPPGGERPDGVVTFRIHDEDPRPDRPLRISRRVDDGDETTIWSLLPLLRRGSVRTARVPVRIE
jgi:hypothetical protein